MKYQKEKMVARAIEGSSPRMQGARNDSISKYANDNTHDFFAECFANACCGKVNVYGKSVVEYLKRRGYLDEK